MMDYFLIVPLLVGFFLALFSLPRWIRKAHTINLVWDDMNKYHKPKVAGSGGIIAVLGFIVAVFIFIAYRTFYQGDSLYLVEILTLLLVVVLAAGIGFIDDLIGWKRGGLSKRSRLFLIALVAIPLMAINAGRHEIALPFLGKITLGIIYPLIFIPLGVVGATTTFNILAGYNGLEAGQGILILSALGLVAFFTGNAWLSIIALCMIVSLFAFLFYNFSPAQVFPGDSLTYAIGSLIAVMSILGNFEKVAVFFFIPYILETILKSRGRLAKHSFGKPTKEGEILQPYDKVYGLEHLAIKVLKSSGIKPTEKRVVYSLWIFQLMLIIMGFIIFREGIFI